MAPDKGHGTPSKNTRDIQESNAQIRSPVKIRGRGGELVFLNDPKRVRRGVVDVEVTQRECGERGCRKYNLWWNGASIVETTLCAVRVANRETSRGRVEKTVRGEEVQCHDITPSEEAGQEGASSPKRTVNIESNAGLAATISGGRKSSKQIKGRKLAPVDRGVLQGDNGRRVGQLRERPEKR